MLAQTNPAAIASNKNSFRSRDINERIRQRDRLIVENALAQGCDYWQMSKAMPKQTFKTWLESQGKTLAEAKKYMRLFETFRDFAIEKIERISLSTLFALTQKRYQQLLSKLWGIPAANEKQISELMAEARKKQQQDSALQRDVRGLVNLPSGGRAFQFPLLHDDEVIARLLQVLEDWGLTARQLLIEAISTLHSKLEVVSKNRQVFEALAV